MRATIDAVVGDILERKGLPPRAPGDAEHLVTDVGLDSLDVAELVTRLEMRLGVDPFARGATATTYADFVAVYERAASEAGTA